MNAVKQLQFKVSSVDQTEYLSAFQIHKLFQNAYRVEAELIGVTSFPPLDRTIRNIKASVSRFFACWDAEVLIALIETTYQEPHLEIDSLVVHPDYFRQGLAGGLLQFVLQHYYWETAEVETAAANLPAITLYEQFGFRETRRFSTPCGILKVALRL